MLTSFDQVREWIIDNGFKRWILYRDYSKSEKIIDSQAFAVSDQQDKLAMTEKYLRMAGGRAYAYGGANPAASELNVFAEIRLADEQGTAGVGTQPQYPQINIGEIRDEMRKTIEAEFRERDYQDRLKKLEEREKELEQDKQSALGAVVHYFAPIGKMLMEKHIIGAPMRNVAGIDAEEPVVPAARIAPIDKETGDPDTEEQEVFTDQEADEIFDLMKRFKAAEPDNWLKMIRTVVQMAEKKDPMYGMAKDFLIK